MRLLIPSRRIAVSVIIALILDEGAKTTAEHPFYVVDSVPWLQTGETQGRWVDAGELQVGNAVRQAACTTRLVQAVVVVQRSQPMYNLTVAVAHTFFVGEQQWLVHNRNCIPALKNVQRQDFFAGGQQFSITKERLQHVLERHHPQYWDGSVKTVQTFLDKDLSIGDVTDLIKSTIQQGFDTRMAAGRRATFTYQAIIDGITYQARTEYGKVVQFFSLP